MRIATWNINSIRIREATVARFVAQHRPDVLCLQETKVEDAHWPHEAIARLGFPHVLFSGQKSYNGVAILSKLPLRPHATYDMIGNGHKRHIAAALPNGIEVHNFYVPAGGDIPDPAVNPKFDEKLRFVAAMRDWSAQEIGPGHRAVAVGDFNIAPLEHDVWSHKQLLKIVSHTPVEVDALNAFLRSGEGWIDAMRALVPHHEKLYSWWSYRNTDWRASNRGRRLDHIWLTPALKSSLKQGWIVQDARGFDNPSDHVPVMVELAI